MQLVNVLLSIGLLAIIYGITILSICAVVASSRNNLSITSLIGKNDKIKPREETDRRSQKNVSFPHTCDDGSKIYFDRRLTRERRYTNAAQT